MRSGVFGRRLRVRHGRRLARAEHPPGVFGAFAAVRPEALSFESNTLDADFLRHAISPAGVRPNIKKMEVLTGMTMPTNAKQLRSLSSGLIYCRKSLPNLSKKLRPVTALLKQGVKFSFSGDMEINLRGLLAQ